ncbi:somatostatin-2-like [Brienomyrus brachyistius]|uniref:somatostatin-2-like n=1 Tax=Brienomyrus brachyistius TaxID=42636 RepID=UPI0020B24FCF|nr:somatostatin-2-like [Brienomyrus brachyistius]
MQFQRTTCTLGLLGPLLLLALCFCGSASQPDLQPRDFFPEAQTAERGPQDWSRQLIGELLRPARFGESMHLDARRSASNSSTPGSRQRKPGCRNIYWKGPTAC